MTEKKVKKWFIDILNSCYPVVDEYPDSIFLYYDESIIRKMKLCELNNIECKIDNVTGKCLFQIDLNNYFFWCDYREIWLFLEKNYSDDYFSIQSFITNRLKENNKLKELIPILKSLLKKSKLEIQDKNNELMPHHCSLSDNMNYGVEYQKLVVLWNMKI